MNITHIRAKKTTLALSLMLATIGSASANIGRSDINFFDYLSFANNTGKYEAGKNNIIVYHTDGSISGVIPHPMPQFSNVEDKGSAALWGNNQYIASVAHVGNKVAKFNRRFLQRPNLKLFFGYNTPNQIADKFNPVYQVHEFQFTGKNGYLDTEFDRLDHLVYDAIPYDVINKQNFNRLIRFGTSYTARVGAGVNSMALLPGLEVHKNVPEQILAGGTNTLQKWDPVAPAMKNPVQSLQYYQKTAIDSSSQPNDSGSPGFVWDDQEKKWIQFGANSRGNGPGYGKTNEFRSQYALGEQVISAYNKKSINFNNLSLEQTDNTKTVTAKDLSSSPSANIKFNSVCFTADNLIFNNADTQITVKNRVDTAYGNLQFNGNATINGDSPNSKLLTAGFLINGSHTVTYNLDIGTNNNLVKLGTGTLIINGNSQSTQPPSLVNSTLSVGNGLTILNSSHGPVANIVRLATGRPTVRLDQDHQINGNSVYFGARGGKLDLNGHNITFNEIYHLDNGAQIINSNSSAVSNITFTNPWTRQYLGDFQGNIDVNYDPNALNNETGWELRSRDTNITGNFNIKKSSVTLDGDSVLFGGDVYLRELDNLNRSASFKFGQVNVYNNASLVIGRAAHVQANLSIGNQAKLNITATGKVLDDINPWYLGQGRDWQVPINTITIDKTIKFLPTDIPSASTSSVPVSSETTTTATTIAPTIESTTFDPVTVAKTLDTDSSSLPTADTTNFNLNLQNNHKAIINSTVTGKVQIFKTGTGEVIFNGDTSQAVGILNLDQGTVRFNHSSDLGNLAVYSNHSATILGISSNLNTTSDTLTTSTDTVAKKLTSVISHLNPNYMGTLSINGQILGLSHSTANGNTNTDDQNLISDLNNHAHLFLGTNTTLDLGDKSNDSAIFDPKLTTLNLGGDQGQVNVYNLKNDSNEQTRTINIGSADASQGLVTLHGVNPHSQLRINVNGRNSLNIIDDNLGITNDVNQFSAKEMAARNTNLGGTLETSLPAKELTDISTKNGIDPFIHLNYGASANYQLSSLVTPDSTGYLLIGSYNSNLTKPSLLDPNSIEAKAEFPMIGNSDSKQVIAATTLSKTVQAYHLANLDQTTNRLAIGASDYSKVTIDQLTMNAQHNYAFSGAGQIIVNSELDPSAQALTVDAQYQTGGVIVLNHSNSNFNGAVTITGNKNHQVNSLGQTGNITVVLGQDHALGNNNSLTLGDGGILNLNGHTAYFKLNGDTNLSAITAYSNVSATNPLKTDKNVPSANIYFTNDDHKDVTINSQLYGKLNLHFAGNANYSLAHDNQLLLGDYYVDQAKFNYHSSIIGDYRYGGAFASMHVLNGGTLNIIGSNLLYASKLFIDQANPSFKTAANYTNLINFVTPQSASNYNPTVQNLILNDDVTINSDSTSHLIIKSARLNGNTLTINNSTVWNLNLVNQDDKKGTVVFNNSKYSISGFNNQFFDHNNVEHVVVNNSTLNFKNYSTFANNGNKGLDYDLSENLAPIDIIGNSTFSIQNYVRFNERVNINPNAILTIKGTTDNHDQLAINFNLSGQGTLALGLTGQTTGQDIYNNFENFTGTLNINQPLVANGQAHTDYVGFNFTNWTGNNTLNFAIVGDSNTTIKNLSKKLIEAPANPGSYYKDPKGGKTITLTNLTGFHGQLLTTEGNFKFFGEHALDSNFTVNLSQGNFLVGADQNQRAITGNLTVNNVDTTKHPTLSIVKDGLGTVELNSNATLHTITNANITQGTLAINTTLNDKLLHQNFSYTVAKDANLEINANQDLNFKVGNTGAGNLIINQQNNHTVNLNFKDLHLTGDVIITNGTLNQVLTTETTTLDRQIKGNGTWMFSRGNLDTVATTTSSTTATSTLAHGQAPTEQALFGTNSHQTTDSQADPSRYHLDGYGDDISDSKVRQVVINTADSLANFKGKILFNNNTGLDVNFTNANLDNISFATVEHAQNVTLRNTNSTTLSVGNLQEFSGNVIAQNGNITLNGVKALNTSAHISAANGNIITLNTLNDEQPVVVDQLQINSPTIVKVGSADLDLSSGQVVLSNLHNLDLQQGNLTVSKNLFTTDTYTPTSASTQATDVATATANQVTLHHNTINFNFSQSSDSDTTLYGQFTGTGVVNLNGNANMHTSQFAQEIDLGLANGNYQLAVNSEAQYLPHTINGNGNLHLTNAQTPATPSTTLVVEHNLDNYTGNLNLDHGVNLEVKAINHSLSVAGAGTVISNFSDIPTAKDSTSTPNSVANSVVKSESNSDSASSDASAETETAPLTTASTQAIADNLQLASSPASLANINLIKIPVSTISKASQPATESEAVSTDSTPVLDLDLSNTPQDFTGTVIARKGDIQILGAKTPLEANYQLDGSRIILSDNNNSALDLSQLKVTNNQASNSNSALVNNVDRTLYLNNASANNINNLDLVQGKVVTKDSVSLNHVNNNGVIDIATNKLKLASYNDNNGNGLIILDLPNTNAATSYDQNINPSDARISIGTDSIKTTNSPNNVNLKLIGDYTKTLAQLVDKSLPLVQTTGKVHIVNLDQINSDSLHHLVVEDKEQTAVITAQATEKMPEPTAKTEAPVQPEAPVVPKVPAPAEPKPTTVTPEPTPTTTPVVSPEIARPVTPIAPQPEAKPEVKPETKSVQPEQPQAVAPVPTAPQKPVAPTQPKAPVTPVQPVAPVQPVVPLTPTKPAQPEPKPVTKPQPQPQHTYVIKSVISERVLSLLTQVSTFQALSLNSDLATSSDFTNTLGVRTFYSELADQYYRTYNSTEYNTQYKNSSYVKGWGVTASKLIATDQAIFNPGLDVKYAKIHTKSQVKNSSSSNLGNLDATLVSAKAKFNFKVKDYVIKSYLGYDYANFNNESKAHLGFINALISLGFNHSYALNSSLNLHLSNDFGMNYQGIVNQSLSNLDPAVKRITNDQPFSFFYNINLNFTYQNWSFGLGGEVRYGNAKFTIHNGKEKVSNTLYAVFSSQAQVNLTYSITKNLILSLECQANNYFNSINYNTKLGLNYSW